MNLILIRKPYFKELKIENRNGTWEWSMKIMTWKDGFGYEGKWENGNDQMEQGNITFPDGRQVSWGIQGWERVMNGNKI